MPTHLQNSLSTAGFTHVFTLLTHWVGQLASNSFWNFSHEEAWSLLSSKHFHSSSLAPQHARLSLEFGAVIVGLPEPDREKVYSWAGELLCCCVTVTNLF